MLREEVTYEDFNGNTVTDVYYFNLTEAELMEKELSTVGGYETIINRIVEARDVSSLVAIFKELLVESVGTKSDDGKRFIKNEQIRDEFLQSQAYSDLFMKLATDDQKAVAWLAGVLPPKFRPSMEDVQKKAAEIQAGTTSTPSN